MSGRSDNGASRRYEQLTLALIAQPDTREPGVSSVLSRGATRATREFRGRRAACVRTKLPAPRVRKVPSRDSRGRFVAYATSTAPSWYVFCCEGYRIPGDAPAELLAPVAPVATNMPASTRARKLRLRVQRTHLESLALVLLILIVSAWYGFQLPLPHR